MSVATPGSYSVHEERLLSQLALLEDIREGRASLIAPPKPSPAKPEVAPPSRDKQAAEDAEAAGSAPAGAPRLPTKLKLKAVRHAASVASTTPEPVAQPARHSEQGEAKPGAPPQQSGQQQQQQQQPARAQREQAAATAPAAAAAEEPGKSIKEPVARATISRDKLAALLKQRQAAAAAAAAASGEPGAAAAESSPSEQLQAQRKTPSRAGQPAAVPTVRTAELGVRRDIGAGSDNPADDTHHDHSRRSPRRSPVHRAPPTTRVPRNTTTVPAPAAVVGAGAGAPDVDFGAVSSPDIDFDDVSEPEVDF